MILEFYILDRNEALKTILTNDVDREVQVFSANIGEKINNLYSLTLEVSATSDEAEKLIVEDYILLKDSDDNWQVYTVKEIIAVNGDDQTKEIFCMHSGKELLDELCNVELNGTAFTVLQSLQYALQDTRWEMGAGTYNGLVTCTEQTLNKDVYSVIQHIREINDLDLKFSFTVVGNQITHRYVELVQDIGVNVGKRFEYDKDIEKVEKTINTEDLKTCVKAYGKDGLNINAIEWVTPTNPLNKPIGKDYLEDPALTAQWGVLIQSDEPYMKGKYMFVENKEIEDATELINFAYATLLANCNPKVTYKMDVVDLFALTGSTDFLHESVGMGDTVLVEDKELVAGSVVGTVIQARIIERNVDLLAPANTTVTIGNYIPNMTDYNNNTANTIVTEVRTKTDLGNGTLDYIKQIQADNTQVFDESTGFTYIKDTEGLWVYDKPETGLPSKVVAIKGGSIAIGRYNETTAKWEVGTFIDGDSVNATMINTGVLNASLIKTGLLQSVDGSSWINMTDGTFNFQNLLKFENGTFSIDYAGTGLESALDSKATAESVAEIHSYMDFTSTGLTIGKGNGSNLQIQIDGEYMRFLNGANVVAYINGQTLNITNATITKQLTVGVHVIERYDSSNITVIKFVGV